MTDVEVVRGGEPTPDELAAIAAALGKVLANASGGRHEPAWLRAAVVEGAGTVAVASVDELARRAAWDARRSGGG